MKAVHFGAGNIGRGFVGLILHRAGYEVVFSDVSAELIASLQAADSYTVHEVGDGARDSEVTGFRAVNSAAEPEALAAELASADVVTTAVGPTVLRFLAGDIARALRDRPEGSAPLVVMACENAIGASDTLRGLVETELGDDAALLSRAVFANTAVDRIVPAQAPDAGLAVTVETFFEWVIETRAFDGDVPVIPDAVFVDELAPFIERKLFTVNTGHATAAYLGAQAGHELIAEAMADAKVYAAVEAALQETSALLVAKHDLDPDAQAAYREKILTRFTNEALPDTVLRVGRQPLRKLSRTERFVGPAAELAERGMSVSALLDAVRAALRFDDPADEQSVELQALLREGRPAEIVARVTGLEESHPLTPALIDAVAARRAELA